MRRSPCDKDCPKRNETCHATCEEYVKWDKENRKEREEIYKRRMEENALLEVSRGYGQRTYYGGKRGKR